MPRHEDMFSMSSPLCLLLHMSHAEDGVCLGHILLVGEELDAESNLCSDILLSNGDQYEEHISMYDGLVPLCRHIHLCRHVCVWLCSYDCSVMYATSMRVY